MERLFFVIFLSLIAAFPDLVKAISCTVDGTGQYGECMFMTDCPSVLNDYTKLKKMPTICDKKYRTVCCPMRTTTTSTTTKTTTQSPKRVSERKCREYAQYNFMNYTVQSAVYGENAVNNQKDDCGHMAVELIVGGTEATEREFPHMALIGYREGASDDYLCGGSLISDLWVISAAHCAETDEGPAKFAKLGHIIRNRATNNSWTHTIVQRVVYPGYNSDLAHDDIALFKLGSAAKLGRYVVPICLPQTEVQTTKKAIATGWGRKGFSDDVSEKLLKVTLEYFNRSICDHQYEDDDRLNNQGINWSKMLCAGSKSKSGDTCNGDSGGPLQIYNPSVECMYTIEGITSFGSIFCGAVGVPAIYTKVFFYLDWIEANVWPN